MRTDSHGGALPRALAGNGEAPAFVKEEVVCGRREKVRVGLLGVSGWRSRLLAGDIALGGTVWMTARSLVLSVPKPSGDDDKKDQTHSFAKRDNSHFFLITH
jgi:hypothetical protein